MKTKIKNWMENALAGALVVLFYGLIMLVLLGIVTGFRYVECKWKTDDIGFASRYELFGGCQIEVTPGQWIPLDAYYFKQE